jgi:hypothetical protein
VGLRGGFRQSLFLDSDRVVRFQFQCRNTQSARTSRNGSGGHVFPGLDSVVPEKLNPIGTQTDHRAQSSDGKLEKAKKSQPS